MHMVAPLIGESCSKVAQAGILRGLDFQRIQTTVLLFWEKNNCFAIAEFFLWNSKAFASGNATRVTTPCPRGQHTAAIGSRWLTVVAECTPSHSAVQKNVVRTVRMAMVQEKCSDYFSKWRRVTRRTGTRVLMVPWYYE